MNKPKAQFRLVRRAVWQTVKSATALTLVAHSKASHPANHACPLQASLLHALRHRLRLQGQLGGEEGVVLGHGVFGATPFSLRNWEMASREMLSGTPMSSGFLSPLRCRTRVVNSRFSRHSNDATVEYGHLTH